MQAEDIIKSMDAISEQVKAIHGQQRELGRIIGLLNRIADVSVEAFSAIGLQKTGDQKPWEVARDTLKKIIDIGAELP